MNVLVAIESPIRAVAILLASIKSACSVPTASAICSDMLPVWKVGSGCFSKSPVSACWAKVRTKALVMVSSLLIKAWVTP
ncbi:hypothetical protein D9M71_802640 [compost metagenome]